MATNPQNFIQPTAQAATPFVPNNGNPNTVYNTTATPFGGQAAGWQNITPFGGTNIGNLWSFAPASTALPTSAFADESSRFWQNMSGVAPAQFDLSNSGAMGPAGNNPFIPAPAPEPVPGTGITVPGDVDVDIHPHDPNFRPTPVGGGGTSDGSSDGSRFHELTQGNNAGGIGTLPLNPNPGGSLPNNSPDWLRGMSDAVGRGWDGLKEALGFRGDSISAMQVVDWFLPGDLVDANTGRINWDQAAKTALNLMSPGLGSLVEAAIDKGLLGSQLQEWLNGLRFERGAIEQSRRTGQAIDDMQRDLFDRFAGDMASRFNVPLNVRDIPMGSVSIGPLSNPNTTAAPQTGNTAIGADTATGSARDPFATEEESNPFQQQQAAGGGRNAMSAGSTVLAEGQAAQDMFAEMTSYSAQQRMMDAQARALNERMSNQMR